MHIAWITWLSMNIFKYVSIAPNAFLFFFAHTHTTCAHVHTAISEVLAATPDCSPWINMGGVYCGLLELNVCSSALVKMSQSRSRWYFESRFLFIYLFEIPWSQRPSSFCFLTTFRIVNDSDGHSWWIYSTGGPKWVSFVTAKIKV